MCNDNKHTNNNETNPASLTENNPAINSKSDSITYEIGKRVFIVNPAYRDNTDKTVCSSLLNLMIKDIENY